MKKKNKCTCDENCECGCKEGKECTCENCNCNDNCECDNCNCDDKKEKKNKKDNKLSDLEEKNKVLNDRVLRLSAEIQNLGKRHTEEMLNMFKYEGIELIKSILPIVDNFERAIDAPCSDEEYHKGMSMILEQLRGLLEKQGVTAVIPLGEAFNPNIHQAIKREEASLMRSPQLYISS